MIPRMPENLKRIDLKWVKIFSIKDLTTCWEFWTILTYEKW